MRFREFAKEFELDDEDEDFLPTRLVEGDLKGAGWKIKETLSLSNIHKKFNDLNVIITNPNFYNDGHIIAESRKSIIQACGHPIIKYDNREYWNILQLVKNNGVEVLKSMKDWEWLQVSDWIVVEKKQNFLLAQFNEWNKLPVRKEVEK